MPPPSTDLERAEIQPVETGRVQQAVEQGVDAGDDREA
jgi:hypothetical protein